MFWFFGPEVCRVLALQPGIEPAPSALEGELLTTGPPGKSLKVLMYWYNSNNSTCSAFQVFPWVLRKDIYYNLCTNYFGSWCNIRLSWVLHYFGMDSFRTILFPFICLTKIQELKTETEIKWVQGFAGWLMSTLPTYKTFEIALCHLEPGGSWFFLAESQTVFLEQILKYVLSPQLSKVTLQFLNIWPVSW